MKRLPALCLALIAAPAWAGLDVPPPPVDLTGVGMQISAVQASIPTVSTTTPTCISDTAAIGTNMNQFAPANHTHCSKIRKLRVVGVTTASYTWTNYQNAAGTALPFTAGVIPICQATVEDPANSANDSYNVEIAGVPSATSATFRIIRQTVGLLSLLTGALSLNSTPGTVNLHLTCFEP